MPDLNSLKAILASVEEGHETLNQARALAEKAGLPEENRRALDEASALLHQTIRRLVAETRHSAARMSAVRMSAPPNPAPDGSITVLRPIKLDPDKIRERRDDGGNR